jgi:hypothetical protein
MDCREGREMPSQIARLPLVAALLFGTPALAHHSHAMYEDERQITLTGTVTQLQWSNPHVFLYIAVPGENGQSLNWALEGGSPTQLLEQGWPQGNPQPGDRISVTVRPLKAGARGGLIRTVTFADNTEFVYGGGPESSLRDNPPQGY